MKVTVFKVRVWKFIRRKRSNSISFVAKLFGKRSGSAHDEAVARGEHVQDNPDLVRDLEDSDHGEFEFEEQGPAITSREGTAVLSSRRLSFRGQLQQEQPLEPTITSRGGTAALSSRRLSFSGQHELEQGPAVTKRGRSGSRRLSFSGQQELEQGPAITNRGGTAGLSSRRLCFGGNGQHEHEQGSAITRTAALGSRRLSFSGQQELEQGPAISKRGRSGSRRLSFSGQQELEQGPAITNRGGTAGLSSRRLSLSGQQDDHKGQSKRHMQVITMWNPESVSTVEAPVESSPKIWAKQASKRWREYGSGRRIVDPIENGPETGSQDWRTRFLDIDPDRRWPVQGW